jgi:23S rRNA (uracil1939-C5)-methyltransferase
MKEIPVKIDSMAFGGNGVARVEGKVVFIPYTISGEEAWIEIVEEKRSYSIGKLNRLIDPSPWRVVSPCPYFGVCGGCQWQHINYSTHGELKEEILREVLERIGGMEKIPSITVLPSPDAYGYRVRVQLKVKGNGIGYYQERSHHLVEIDHCPIAHPLVNQLIQFLRKDLPAFSRMQEIEINVSPEEEKGICLFHPVSPGRNSPDSLKTLDDPTLKGFAVVREGGLDLFGNPSLTLTVAFALDGEEKSVRLQASPGSFFQVNLKQNQKLVQTVLEYSDLKGNERILDLYSGIGNFTLPLAMGAKEVIGIEENKRAVKDARFNAERNEIENCSFVRTKVEDALKSWSEKPPDLLILDPPRTGCKTIIDQVAALKSEKIIYTSCEPTTFSRDLRLFSERGYSLDRLALIDMFPQSFHMEVVGLLSPLC